MKETALSGWSAWFNGITSIAGTLTLVLMFTIAGFFAPVNDAARFIWVLADRAQAAIRAREAGLN